MLSLFHYYCLYACALLLLAVSPVWCWPPPSDGSWKDVTSTTQFPTGRALVVTDWNNDKVSDLMMLRPDNKTIALYIWDNDNNLFAESGNNVSFRSSTAEDDTDVAVISAVAADFNRDGHNDLAVLTADGELHFIEGPTLNESSNKIVPHIAMAPVPSLNALVLDGGHCALVDLVALAANGSLVRVRNTDPNSSNQDETDCAHEPRRKIAWVTEVIVEKYSQQQELQQYSSSQYPAYGTGAVDFNGDCRSDFFYPLKMDHSSNNISSIVYAIGLLPPAPPASTLRIPSFWGPVPYFDDMNEDGAMDILFPACIHPTRISNINNNTHNYICADGFDAVAILLNIVDGEVCDTDNCCARHSTGFTSVHYNEASGHYVPTMPHHSELASGSSHSTSVRGDNSAEGYFVLIPLDCSSRQAFTDAYFNIHNTSNYHRSVGAPPTPPQEQIRLIHTTTHPAVVRTCDSDRNHRPHLLLSTTRGPMLLLNKGDMAFTCTPLDERRLDDKDSDYMYAIAFPFDMGDVGTVDIVGFSLAASGTGYAYWNGMNNEERYFLTATMLNGARLEDGGTAWGAVQVGGVHRFQWQDVNTKTRTASTTHLATSAGHALLSPHAHFGLGRTYSYVNNYATGVRLTSKSGGYRLWSAFLVPNSQVVCLADPINSPNDWQLRLFLYPLRFLRLIIVVLPTALALLGIPIIILKWREILADRAEKMQQLS